ncbi:hypothetical protein BRD00_11625 [Halobacteriales archaeon QS_8_69_26]|nr:MAG: hypothetical protein BRD00_11625 [Halobacteriales archaeon QS_8_69_26]
MLSDFLTGETADPDTSETVAFDASPASDEEEIVRYEWDFDGDGEAEETGETVTHSFGDTGLKYVELTVVDGEGRTDSVERTVPVSSVDDGTETTADDGTETTESDGTGTEETTESDGTGTGETTESDGTGTEETTDTTSDDTETTAAPTTDEGTDATDGGEDGDGGGIPGFGPAVAVVALLLAALLAHRRRD